MSAKTKKYLVVGGFIALFVVGLPVFTFLSQKKQNVKSNASASTTLYLMPSSSSATPLTMNVGSSTSLDVMINPGNNVVSTVKLEILYDQTKFKLTDATNPFTVNISSFPVILEGPIVNPGDIIITVGINSDTTKAISTVTKVGTINLTAIAQSSASTNVSFGNNSQVLSVASTDNLNENVLSTTIPAYVTIANALTPTQIATPTLTQSPTTTPTPTPVPTLTPTAILTPTPSQSTILSLKLLFHGIGQGGDSANPNGGGNANPLHPQRNVTVEIYDSNNTLVLTKTGIVSFNPTSGNFIGTVDLGTTFTTGVYSVKIKSDQFLRALIPGIQTIIAGVVNQLPQTTLISGDINGDNVVNILDYNILIGCYSDFTSAVSCTPANKLLSDLDDDGNVNQFDYNLFLRELTNLQGQ